MNIFIYDSFLNQKKYDRLLARLETRLTDLGLNGKISRLNLMRNVQDTVANELKRGATTIVAVGNDKTANQIINSLAGSLVPLAVIPVGETDNEIAKSLGINSLEDACNILSARLLARLDLGLANQTYFLGKAAIANQGTLIDMSADYTIETGVKGLIQVFNLVDTTIKLPPKFKFSPDDGILELVISAQGNKKIFSRQNDQSIFKIKKVRISNPRAQLILDSAAAVGTPADISVAKQKLNVIVGKNRKF